ncbi:MAG: hypothetical protein IJV07_03730 [Alphaproteobacteria bacterium]|nr:hypothetical protein [Alphaproteobacteria bacterium]
MSRRAFISSAVLHGAILTLLAMDFSFAKFDNTPPQPAVLMIDLSKVQVADKTNLPPKKTPTKKVKQANVPSAQSTKVMPTRVQSKKPEPPAPKPIPQPEPKNAVPVVSPKKPAESKKEKLKPKPMPVPAPKSTEKANTTDRLKSLLTSVEKIKKSAPIQTQSPEPDALQVTDGIENGTDGSLSQILTISERDLIASRLSGCWNLDAGKKDIDDMIVEIRVWVNKDGSVRDAKILNTPTDPIRKSVAESAKRAVWICDRDETKSPFKILAEKYADHYNDWKTLFLRFNPATGGVM